MPPLPADLTARLSCCMAADFRRLHAQARKLTERAQAGRDVSRDLARLMEDIKRSSERRNARLERLPVPEFQPELPVNERRDDIAQAIQRHQVVIVCGETGSGKTTQLPKICLALQRGAAGMIACTQPRRIAARSVASRLACELGTEVGRGVGYKIRFTDRVGPDSYIKVMTDGILLAETHGDRDLAAYDTIIIDEAHERSLNIDFLLGYVKQLLARRPDLKVIITSATIDAGRFAHHFAQHGHNAPVIEVSGRLYPVEVRYRPPEALEGEEQPDLNASILSAVDELCGLSSSGDVLVFLPGEREIREAAESLRKHHPPHTEILPLFARLSAEDQDKVFKPSGARRIVLATNVAETSLTVPGIRYVVDSGLARMNRYSVRAKVSQLQVEPIAQAAAKQRAGRCGRLADGVCIRLYGEDDFNARPEFTTPEILRSSLAAVILRMAAMELGDVEAFPLIDPPSPRAITDGYQLLAELGAVDDARRLTAVGQELARLPIDPKLGRILLAAREQHCLSEAVVICAALSVPDPRERPQDKQGAVSQAQQKFLDEKSDFLSFIKLWQFFEDALSHKKSNRKLAQLCREHFLSYFRMREWRDIHGQLHALTAEMGMRENPTPATYEQIHKALLAGLLGNIGCKDLEGDQYLGARQIKFVLSTASALRRAKPKWVMAAELQETNRLYARCVARIEPEWIEPVAGPALLKRSYFDPHWEKQSAQVTAYERVLLHGLTIVSKRRVHYGPINPSEARALFIRQALVAGDYDSRAPFFAHNHHLVSAIEELEHKARRQDVLVDEQAIFRFYDALIPADVVNGAGFEHWRKQAEGKDPKLLYLTREYLMRHGASTVTEDQFPETVAMAGIDLPLSYRFEPGHPLDGVTLTLPLHVLNQLDETRCDWLVPGLVREKVAWYLKALPKQIRRHVVPVPEFTTTSLEAMQPYAKPIALTLAGFIQARTGVAVPPDAWEGEKLPAHLRMNFRVVDNAGQELAMGRNLAALRAQLGQAAQLTFAQAEPGIERSGVKHWDFGDLPEKISFDKDGHKLVGYPALVDEGDACAIRLFDSSAAAQASMRAGVRRLLRLELKEQLKQLEKGLAGFNPIAIQLRPAMTPDTLLEDVLTTIADRAFIGDDALPRSEAEFNALKQRARTRLPAVRDAALRLLASIAEEYHLANQRIAATGPALARLKRELSEQLAALVFQNFLTATPWERLPHLPRYLKAIRLRLDKYATNPERDGKHATAVASLWQRYLQRLEKHRKTGTQDLKLAEFRWLIEELRVSLFAQELKTPMPVSAKRLEKAWESVQA